jgi:hypothetical protein
MDRPNGLSIEGVFALVAGAETKASQMPGAFGILSVVLKV